MCGRGQTTTADTLAPVNAWHAGHVHLYMEAYTCHKLKPKLCPLVFHLMASSGEYSCMFATSEGTRFTGSRLSCEKQINKKFQFFGRSPQPHSRHAWRRCLCIYTCVRCVYVCLARPRSALAPRPVHRRLGLEKTKQQAPPTTRLQEDTLLGASAVVAVRQKMSLATFQGRHVPSY